MAEVKWSKISLNDLTGIYRFIAENSDYYATILVDSLIDSTNILNEFPLSGRIVPEKSNPTIRELIFGNYRIFYRVVSSKRVTILRVHHAAKKIK